MCTAWHIQQYVHGLTGKHWLQGYPWYAQYPPPSFPHDNLTVTNHSIHHNLKAAVLAAAEEQRKAEEAKLAERAKQAQAARATQQLSVAEMTRHAPVPCRTFFSKPGSWKDLMLAHMLPSNG